MVTTIPAGTLRLLLTSISYRAKARKSYGGSRQWFRAAVPGRKHNARLTRCQANARRGKHGDSAGLAWSAICCALIYLIIIGQLYRAAVLSCIASGVAVVFGIGAGRPGA